MLLNQLAEVVQQLPTFRRRQIAPITIECCPRSLHSFVDIFGFGSVDRSDFGLVGGVDGGDLVAFARRQPLIVYEKACGLRVFDSIWRSKVDAQWLGCRCEPPPPGIERYRERGSAVEGRAKKSARARNHGLKKWKGSSDLLSCIAIADRKSVV